MVNASEALRQEHLEIAASQSDEDGLVASRRRQPNPVPAGPSEDSYEPDEENSSRSKKKKKKSK